MQEIKTTEQDAEATSPPPQKDIVQRRDRPSRRSRESLWGVVLFAGMLLFVLVSVSGIGWIVYSQWKVERVAESQLSISTLPAPSSGEQAAPSETETEALSEPETASPNTEDTLASAQKLDISILNGGAAKGSAGVLADALKKEGYAKVQPGNTINDYTGVTVYYAANLQKEAEIIKESVAKKYSQVTILPADDKNKETSVSQITVIIGK